MTKRAPSEQSQIAAFTLRLIVKAGRLYEKKGTPTGLADFIEVVTGRRPLIRESFEAARPEIVGDGLRLEACAR